MRFTSRPTNAKDGGIGIGRGVDMLALRIERGFGCMQVCRILDEESLFYELCSLIRVFCYSLLG